MREEKFFFSHKISPFRILLHASVLKIDSKGKILGKNHRLKSLLRTQKATKEDKVIISLLSCPFFFGLNHIVLFFFSFLSLPSFLSFLFLFLFFPFLVHLTFFSLFLLRQSFLFSLSLSSLIFLFFIFLFSLPIPYSKKI